MKERYIINILRFLSFLVKIYYENFASGVRADESECYVAISENTTFAEARKYANGGRVAVLNFANPVNPGGGVENGAMVQEECLCRSSNLYTCLRADHLFNDYYLCVKTVPKP
mgnify:CR=1 FL=1